MQQADRKDVPGKDFTKITPTVSETLCLLAHSFKNSLDYIEALRKDSTVPDFAKQSFLYQMKIKTQYCKREIDLRVTGEESKRRYEQLVKTADSQAFANMLHIMSVMTPEQMEIAEQVIQAIGNGEKIEIEKIDE